MIIEHASLQVDADRAAEFAEVFIEAQAVLARADGVIASQLLEDVETPGLFVLAVQWETLEDHTEKFAGSELFDEFKAVVGPFLLAAPAVRHFRHATAVPER